MQLFNLGADLTRKVFCTIQWCYKVYLTKLERDTSVYNYEGLALNNILVHLEDYLVMWHIF